MQDNQKLTKNREFLLSLLKVTIDDINYIKNRHWTITNYVLLLLAALVGFTKLFPEGYFKLNDSLGLILLHTVLFIFCLGTYFLYKFQNSLTLYRKRFENTYNKLKEIDEEFESLWEHHPKDYTSFWKDFFSTVFCFWVVQLLGTSFVIWFLYKNP
jgi:hypothetical protein